MENKQLTFGEKAMGITFNPAKDPLVDDIKRIAAQLADIIQEARLDTNISGKIRYYSKALSHLEDAQMNAVKAVTWQYD